MIQKKIQTKKNYRGERERGKTADVAVLVLGESR
jgi:hypothetical protein